MATVFPVEQPPPTAFKLQHSSPLDTLVRRTSAKRARAVVQSTASSQQYPSSLIDEYVTPQVISSQDEQDADVDPYGGYATSEIPQGLPNRSFAYQRQPVSPLLHSHFARNSTATASMAGSYSDLRSSMCSKNVYQELEYRYRDDESVYSQVDSLTSTLPDTWRPGGRPEDYIPQKATTKSDKAPGITLGAGRAAVVPTVVVSSPDVDNGNNGSRSGRVPVVRRITSNFSRPVRPSSQSEQYTITLQQTMTPPPLPQNAHDQKRRVLERNAHRAVSNPPSQLPHSQEQMRFFRRSKSPTPSAPAPSVYPYIGVPAIRVQQAQPTSPTSPDDSSPNPYAEQPTPTPPYQSNQHRGPSPKISDSQSPQQPLSGQQPSDHRSPQTTSSLSSLPVNEKSTGLSPVALFRHPPARSNSPASLYSTYSYYNFENAVPSPVSSEPPSRASPAPQQPSNGPTHLQLTFSPDLSQQPQHPRSPNSNNNPRVSSPLAGNPASSENDQQSPTPQDFLQLGIQNHEANRLRESALYFEKSAKENGGCGVGMLMWGLTLRHGWGCEKNEKVGFKWLSKAAESAVSDLETARSSNGKDTLLIQDELVLAIYEVGQCFFHGWGVQKDQKMAVSYYTVAARLGDPDAQNDLAFCLANGKGCKKDRKEAAKWYRAAVAQGASDVGLAWIYKEKFM